MATVGDLVVNLGLNGAPFTKGLMLAKSKLAAFGGGLKSTAASLVGFGGSLTGVAGVAGLGMLVKSSLDTIDALAHTSEKIGIATDKLGGLRYAAKLANVEAETLDKNLVVMVKNLSAAAAGGGPAANAIGELGIEAAKLKGMAPEQQLGVIADALMGVADQGDRTRLAIALFGKAGSDMLPMLSGGSKLLAEMQAEAERLGITLDQLAVQNVVEANDAIDRMKETFGGLKNELTAGLAPAIEVLAGALTGLVMIYRDLQVPFRELGEILDKLILGIDRAPKVKPSRPVNDVMDAMMPVGGGGAAAPVLPELPPLPADIINGNTFRPRLSPLGPIGAPRMPAPAFIPPPLETGLPSLDMPGGLPVEVVNAAEVMGGGPEGHESTSKEFLEKLTRFRNGAGDPQRQTADNTRVAATELRGMRKDIAKLASTPPVKVGAFV